MQVLIAGGGIGGLAAALCLHRAGVEATVFEAAAALHPLGVGINLLPHAVRILTHLGLGSRLAEAAVATAELVYCNKFGRPIWREPRGLAAGYRWPQYSVHRGRLQMLLLDEAQARLGPERVLVGHRLTTFSDRGRRVAAEFVDRRTGQAVTREADVLVGADGIHSAVRRPFYPDEGPPRFSGRMLWRGVSDSLPFLTGRSMVMIGHARQKFVAYPICPAAAAGELGRRAGDRLGRGPAGAGLEPSGRPGRVRAEVRRVAVRLAGRSRVDSRGG